MSDKQLTAKGQATRARILDVAAELFYERGIAQTTNDEIRTRAGVSGSQLNHYFPSRAALVDAVLAKRLDDAVDPALFPDSGMPHSLESLQAWADTYVRRYQTLTGGCRVGSLAAETLKSAIDVREQLAAGYERWRATLGDGLRIMQDNGELDPAADPDQLALVLLTALQGGLLMTQVSGSTTPLRTALDGAIQLVRDHAAVRDHATSEPVRRRAARGRGR